MDTCRLPRKHDAVPASPTPITPVRVLVVDDQRYFQDVVRDLIDATSGFECVGAVCTGEEGIDQADRLRPDMVLMDVRMPGIGGIEAARRLNAANHRPLVVLVSAEEGLTGRPGSGASRVVPKRRLCRALLRRLWEEHGEPLVEPSS